MENLTIKQLQEKINNLENEILKAKQQIDDVLKKPSEYKRWRANKEGRYYFINEFGNVIETYEKNTETDSAKYGFGNYYKTAEFCNKKSSNKFFYQKLEDIALELNQGVAIDWDNRNQKKYYIKCNQFGLKQNYTCEDKTLGTIYCLDKNFLDVAIFRLEQKNIIDLIRIGI